MTRIYQRGIYCLYALALSFSKKRLGNTSSFQMIPEIPCKRIIRGSIYILYIIGFSIARLNLRLESRHCRQKSFGLRNHFISPPVSVFVSKATQVWLGARNSFGVHVPMPLPPEEQRWRGSFSPGYLFAFVWYFPIGGGTGTRLPPRCVGLAPGYHHAHRLPAFP